MNIELLQQQRRQRSKVMALAFIAGLIGSFIIGMIGCHPAPATRVPVYSVVPMPPAITPSLVVTSTPVVAQRMLTTPTAAAPALTLNVSTSAPASVVAVAPYNGRGSISLAWDASPDPTATGYRVYYGLQSDNYTNSATVGKVLKCTVTGLFEGATYYFACVAYDTNAVEGAFSNEAVGSVPFYVAIRTQNWTVETYGRAGVTNQVLKSTNLTSWTVVKEFVGVAGLLTNISEPNAASAYYRVVVKP